MTFSRTTGSGEREQPKTRSRAARSRRPRTRGRLGARRFRSRNGVRQAHAHVDSIVGEVRFLKSYMTILHCLENEIYLELLVSCPWRKWNKSHDSPVCS